MRRILITGGAPRVTIDTLRFMSVTASGATAVGLATLLRQRCLGVDLLLSTLAVAERTAERFDQRADLERKLATWIDANPDGVVVMTAAVYDYRLHTVEQVRDGIVTTATPGTKLPSGADELVIRLRPADKLIDRLRGMGLRGPIIGCKYEAADSVLASAEALRQRVGCAFVIANSLCGQVQAIVDDHGVETAPDRPALVGRWCARVADLVA